MSCSKCAAAAFINKSDSDTQTIDNECGKLSSYNWLDDLPDTINQSDIVEIKFKNTRKDFFINSNKLGLKRGDYVTVSAQRGHDIGQVNLTGKVALLQLKRKNLKNKPTLIIYRKATHSDIEKWQQSRLREKTIMIRARKIAEELSLKMKISDVELQGDGSKATFYYIAEGRVDFRELIKQYAHEFSIKIDMRQIGARQEAAMVGGIASCGKELCCSSWRSSLDSVSSNAARIQQLPNNIQKLTGQCGKLKCCLMYELDNYIEAQSDFPNILLELETDNGTAYPRKKEVLKKIIWYSIGKAIGAPMIPLSLKRVKEIIMLNKKGIKAPDLIEEVIITKEPEFKSFENNFDILEKPNKNKRNKKSFKKKPFNRNKPDVRNK